MLVAALARPLLGLLGRLADVVLRLLDALAREDARNERAWAAAAGDTAALPSVSPYDDVRSPARDTAPRTGRTGVASGRLHPRDERSGNTDPVGDDHLTPTSERISANRFMGLSGSWRAATRGPRPGACDPGLR